MNGRYRSGEIVPKCSMYLVKHHLHSGIRLVIGTAGDIFPPCKLCGNAVSFEQLFLSDYSQGELLAGHPEFFFPNLRADTEASGAA